MDIIWATVIGFVVGISGTVIGGIVIYRSANSPPKHSLLLGLSGGIMVAVVIFDLWPEALHYGGLLPGLAGTVLGIAIIHYFEWFMNGIPWYQKRHFSKTTKLGLLLGMGIGTHNFPEGVALGATFITDPALRHWGGLGVLMAVHNIPEGMVMSSALKLGKVRFGKIFTALFLVEIPMAFGSMVGAILGQISGWMASIALGFAGGAMFYLVIKELLPMARKMAGFFWVSLGFLIGFWLGVVLVRAI